MILPLGTHRASPAAHYLRFRSLYGYLGSGGGVTGGTVIFTSGLLLVFVRSAAWVAPLLLLLILLLEAPHGPVIERNILLASSLLLGGAVIGSLASFDSAESLSKFWTVLSGLLMLLLLARRRGRDLRATVWLLLACGAVLGLAACIQVDRNSWKLNGYNRTVYGLFAHIPRFSEVALNQNAVAAWLIAVIPLGLAFTASTYARRTRVIAAGLVTLLLFELSLTNSRAALLSLAIGVAVGGVVAGGILRWLGAAVFCGALALLRLGVLGLPFRFALLPTGGSSRERVAIWLSTLHMLADAPFTGVGVGLFQRVYPLYMLPAYHIDYPHAHNLFLQAGVDMGVLGVAGWLVLAGLAALWIVRLIRMKCSDQSTRWLGAGAAASVAAMLAHSQVDSYFAGDSQTYFLPFILLGILAGCAAGSRSSGGGYRQLRGATLAGLLVLTLIAAGAWDWRALASEMLVNAGTVRRLEAEVGASRQRVADLEGAEKAYQQALALDGHNWVAERALGVTSLGLSDASGATKWLQAAVTDGPSSQLTRFELGNAQFADGEVEAAIASWRAADAAAFLAQRGEILASRGASPQAEGWYKLALSVRPGEPQASERLAQLYVARADFPAARHVLEGEIVANPGRAEPHALLGILAYWHDGNLPEAERQLRLAIVCDPTDEALKRALADIYASAGMVEESRRLKDDAEATLLATQRASPTLGRLYETVGFNDRAEREYERVAYGKPCDPVGNYDLGRLYLDEARPADAIRELELAVKAIPNQEEFRLALARAYARLGEPQAAKREYAVVRALDPGSRQAQAWAAGSR